MRMDAGLGEISLASIMRYLEDIPRLSKSLSCTDDETSSNGTTNGNHSNVTRFESTVQMLVVVMDNDTIVVGVEGWCFSSSDNTTTLVLLVTVLGIRAMRAHTLRGRGCSLISVPDGHGRQR
jgi:hypothetical protein